MSWRIIDVSQDGRYLHADREWLVVTQNQEEVGRFPLTDIQSVLVHAGHATYSHALLLRLSAYDIPLVLCDWRHLPIAILVSLAGHHLHAGRVRKQSSAPLPMRKRVWRDLVKAKITEQARSLGTFDPEGRTAMLKFVSTVRAGDPENVEARAARYYWRRLFGGSFYRDRSKPGVNAHLNYGYTILRSALARAVTASGLIPSLGVGHINARNSFCLVDDLMEPFRPLVDRLVWHYQVEWGGDLTDQARSQLAGIMQGAILTKGGETDLYRAMTLVVNSLVAVFEGDLKKIEIPTEIEFVKMPRFPGFDD
jgi:CRISPR-associated protein Cas1